MKKLLIGVFGLCLMLSVVSVQAETIDTENGSASADVTVWNVDTPVYNVEIEWYNLTFNWVYDEEIGSYRWEKNVCVPISQDIKDSFSEELYSNYKTIMFMDQYCTSGNSLSNKDVSFEEASANLDNYYSLDFSDVHVDYRGISIVDNSVNTKITPSIVWNSAENYDWTIGKFYEMHDPACLEITEEEFDSFISSDKTIYTDSSCLRYLEDRDVTWVDDSYYYSTGISFEEIITAELPESLRRDDNVYDIHFKLEVDETKEIITPQIGDTIGTITISIK